ncbi:MAG: hypothetical protein HYZ26_08640 [Chloroflexi bacterium]|nr:hypothetical protein [Chloroflexota bacterium]
MPPDSAAYSPPPPSPEELRRRRLLAAGLGLGALLLVVGLVAGVAYLLAYPQRAANIRDILIIALAVELLLLGVALVTLAVQVARLVNMVQNEVRPLLDSANNAMNTLRGTAEFLSENLSEPVIKLNSYLAGFRRMLETIDLLKKPFQR